MLDRLDQEKVENLLDILAILNDKKDIPLPESALRTIAEDNILVYNWSDRRKLKLLNSELDKAETLYLNEQSSSHNSKDSSYSEESETETASKPNFGLSLVSTAFNFFTSGVTKDTSGSIGKDKESEPVANPDTTELTAENLSSDNSADSENFPDPFAAEYTAEELPVSSSGSGDLEIDSETAIKTLETVMTTPAIMSRSFMAMPKYNEQNGPIRYFLKDLESLLELDGFRADKEKIIALRYVLPNEIKDFIDDNADDDATYKEIKELLIDNYDGSSLRDSAEDKARVFRLRFNENEFEKSVLNYAKLVKESLDTNDKVAIFKEQLKKLKEKLDENLEMTLYFRNNRKFYKTIVEAAADLQGALNDMIRHGRSNSKAKTGNRNRDKDVKKFEVTCNGCFNVGHKIADCRSKDIQCRNGKIVRDQGSSVTNMRMATENPWEKFRNCMMMSSKERNTISMIKTDEKKLENNEIQVVDHGKISKRVTNGSCDIYIKVEFEDGFTVPGLLDTGCQKSAISLSRAIELGYNKNRSKAEDIYVANGSVMLSYGTFVTNLLFDEVSVRSECCVIEDKCFDSFEHYLFVGNDVLKATSSIIDYGKNTIQMCNRYITVVTRENNTKKTQFLVANSLNQNGETALNIDKIKIDYSDRMSTHKFDIGECTLKCPELIVSSEDPPKIKRYPVPEGKRSLVVETIKTWSDNKICVRDDNVRWLMNLVLVPKRDNQDRICLDSRPLNKVLSGDLYSTPTLADIRCKLVNGKYFTTFDMTQSFMQIALDVPSSLKLGFRSPDGYTYRFTRMPFGLKIATSVFQRIIDTVLRGLDFALSYVDDILIVTKTNVSDHYKHIRLVLDRLREFNLKINCAKSQWCGDSVTYLGYVFSSDGQKPSEVNTAAIVNYPSPKSVKALRRYLGKIGYFRNNIENLAELQRPLTNLLRNQIKNAPFFWSEEAETAFLKTKEALIKATTISYPNFTLPFKLFTDASADTFAATLCQELTSGYDTPLGFFSKRNPERKLMIPATYLEIRCVAESLDYFRQYIYGHKTHVFTDHMSIIKICESNTDRNLYRYVERILEYDVEIHYIPGPENVAADALSRANLLRVAVKNKFTKVPKIKNAMKLSAVNNLHDTTEVEKIHVEEKSDIISAIATNDCTKIPKMTNEMKLSAMKAVHDELGHMCFERCYPLLMVRHKWPGMSLDFRKHIQTCETCLSRNEPRKRPYAFQHTSADYPFHMTNMDICGPFRVTNKGNKHFIGLVDVLSKYIVLQEVSDANSDNVIDFLRKFMFIYSCPAVIKFDNAQYFKSHKLIEFLKESKIEYNYSTPGHHEGNSNIERVFRTIHTLMSKELRNNTDLQWDDCLPKIAFFYNCTVHATTKFSPFYLVFGREPVFKQDLTLDVKKLRNLVDYNLESVIDKGHMSFSYKLAKELSSAVRNKLNTLSSDDSADTPTHEYNIGDKILIKRPDFKNERKHECPWKSGYEITNIFENHIECRIRMPNTLKFKGRPKKVFFTEIKPDYALLKNGEVKSDDFGKENNDD
uniref:RNA-directed DNA polymerase n=1 Tax=Parastrongyloides trichosuri TaxID=131310 RepID=A0A0N4Z8A5_PARTI